MAYLRNKKDFDPGLLLSQIFSCKAYKTYIAAIYFKLYKNKNIRCLVKVTTDATDKSNAVFAARLG